VVPFPVQYRSHELTELSKVAALKVFVTTTRIGRREAAVEMASLQPNIPTLERVLAFGRMFQKAWWISTGGCRRRGPLGTRSFQLLFRPRPERLRHHLLDFRHREHAKGRPAHALRLAGHVLDHRRGPQLTKDDVLLNPFPMVNMAGINGMFLPWLRVGGYSSNTTPRSRHLPRPGCKHGATYTVAPPALLTQLLHNEQLLADTDISTLRLLGSGSTPLALRSCRAGMTSTASRSSTSTARTRASPCSGTVDMPTPQSAPCTSPLRGTGRTWSHRVAKWMQVKLVDPVSGEVITEGGHPASCASRVPPCFRLPPGIERGGPFDDEGYLRNR